MIAVIFEVWPKPGHKQRYLDLAAELRPLLYTIDGFISVERFESIYEPGKMLSLSFFRDEAAVNARKYAVITGVSRRRSVSIVLACFRCVLRSADPRYAFAAASN